MGRVVDEVSMRILQVSEFIETVNFVLEGVLGYGRSWSRGEVSGYRVSQGQWVSFDLKDDKALVNVFLPVWNLRVPIEDGIKVRVIGLPRVYPKYGKFSLSAERIELAGEGALKKRWRYFGRDLKKKGFLIRLASANCRDSRNASRLLPRERVLLTATSFE